MTICEQIKVYQKREKATNKDIADILGIDAQNYGKRLNENKLKANEIELICKHLNTEIKLIHKD